MKLLLMVMRMVVNTIPLIRGTRHFVAFPTDGANDGVNVNGGTDLHHVLFGCV